MVWNGNVNYGKQDGGKAKETAPKWSGERPFMAASCGAMSVAEPRNFGWQRKLRLKIS